MSMMFFGAKSFHKDAVKNWDLRGKDTEYMFEFGKNGEKTMEAYKKPKEMKKLETTGKFGNITLKMAVKEWCERNSAADCSLALAKYGHISGWDGEMQ